MNNSSSERGLKVRIEVNSDGKITIHGISVLEELWEDYHFFRKRALETSPQENLIRA